MTDRRTGRFDGRVAAVVGSGSAVAAACADRFRDEGASVLLVDHAGSEQPVLAAGTDWITADLTSSAGAIRVREHCRDRWGRLDVLFYAHSGIDAAASDGAAEAFDRGEWERVLTSNLWGPMSYSRAMIPLLSEQGGGSIVFLTSIDGLLGNPSYPAFSTTKAALAGLTRLIAHDGAPRGVRANAVATAAMVQTKVGEPGPRPGTSMQKVVAVTPLQRPPTVAEVAGVVSFFGSDDSAYVTGVVLPMDGGRLAVTPGCLRLPNPSQ